MITFFLALLLALFTSIYAQQQIPSVPTLGPPQICRCYPVGAPNVCPTGPPPTFTITNVPAGQCQTQTNVEISFVADDGVILWICGVNVRQSSNFDEEQSFRYQGNCDSFMLQVTNTGLSAGVALLATFNGQKYGTTDMSGKFSVPGTLPLFAISKFNPPGPWFNNPPTYDFSSWTPAVVVESIVNIPQQNAPNFHKLIAQGAFPINVQSGDVSPGIYALKLSVPFC